MPSAEFIIQFQNKTSKIMLTGIFMLIIALIMILIGAKILVDIRKIKDNGVSVSGIIFDLEQSIDAEDRNATSIFPKVRFLTNKHEWITQTSKIGVIPGIYKTGESVQIIYQADNPNNFFIKDKFTQIIPILLLVIALILIITSIACLISI